MSNNNNQKEAVKLLNTNTSDSDSSDPEIHFAPPPPIQTRRKIRTKRKSRRIGNDAINSGDSSLPCSLSSVLKTAAVAFTLCGLLILGWMVTNLHSEVQSLTQKLASLPSSDDQRIMDLTSQLKEFKSNQSIFTESFRNQSEIISVIQKQTASINTDVEVIHNSLKDAPQMLNIGNELESLKSGLANYEASMTDLKHSVEELRNGGNDGVQHIVANLNNTVWAKLDWVVEDLHKHHGMIEELSSRVQNLTELLSNSNNLLKRVDAIQTQLIQVDGQQRNTSITMRYVLDLLHNMDGDLSKAKNN